MTATGRFLTGRFSLIDDPEDAVFHALALLILAISQRPPVSLPALERIADWVLDIETEMRKQLQSAGFQLPYCPFSVEKGDWKPSQDVLKSAACGDDSASFKEKLLLCALIVEPDHYDHG